MPQSSNRQASEFEIRPGTFGTRDTLRVMVDVARNGAADPAVRGQAEAIVSFLPGRAHAHEVNAVFLWVRDNIRYLAGPLGFEQVHAPDVLLETRQGKCTDQAVLLASLLRSIGYPIRFVAAAYSMPLLFEHVYVQTMVNGEWVSLDTTLTPEPDCDTIVCPGDYAYDPPGALSRMVQNV